MNIKFDLETMNKLFPFYIIVNPEGDIVSSGVTMDKLMGLSPLSKKFDNYFSINKPIHTSWNELMGNTVNQMIVLKMKNPEVNLMGQALSVPDQNLKLFAMNIVVQSPDELTGLQLDFNDFAIQDPIFDYLLLLQTERRATKKADIANKKLIEANLVAIRASAAKSQFLANMSHELRTPMNGVLGMASVLLDTPLDDMQKECVQTILTSGDSMVSLVNDILDLSKIEAGYINLDKSEFELKTLIHEILSHVSNTANKKNIDLSVFVSELVPQKLFTDRERLRQVVLNLVANAVKFTHSGFVKINIEREEQNLIIQVIDSGIGMNQQTLDQLFSPFVQGDSSMTKKFEGTGLGLAIIKKIIDAMNGEIKVRSREGSGSEFEVRLPLMYGDNSA